MKNLSDYEIFEEVCAQLPKCHFVKKHCYRLNFTRVQRKRNH